VKFRSWVEHARSRYHDMVAMGPRLKPWRAYWNWALANASMLLRTTRLHARPLKLTFDPTNICQLACPLCPTGLRIQDRKPDSAPLGAFERLMDEVGDYIFFLDLYNWGEPLLNPQLPDMIGIAARKGIVTCVSTNLSLPLPEDRLRALLTSGLSELIVSIDGASQATYGTYRRRGNWSLAVENLRRLAAARKELGQGRPLLTWRFYVFRFNEHEIDRARAMAEEIGVDRIVFGTPFLEDARFSAPEGIVDIDRGWASTIPEYNRYQPGHPEYSPPGTAAVRKRCDWHYVSTAINPDGTVSPCCAVYGMQNDFGVLDGSQSYMELVNGPRFRAIRDRFAGRRSDSTGLVCERCPTPSIMNYGSILNRQIALLTVAALWRAVFRAGEQGGQAPNPSPPSRLPQRTTGSGAPEM